MTHGGFSGKLMWFEKLSSQLRAEILLCKASEYFSMLNELSSMVNGLHAAPGSAKCPSGHFLGTKYTCKDCALYMTKFVAKKLPPGGY